MRVEQAKRERPREKWRVYLFGFLGVLLSAILAVAIVYFQDEIRYVKGYGYIGVFIVGVLCGITIIPAPTLLLVFTLGSVLDPVYVALVAGLGGGLGGITIYLTGAGAETIWSKLRAKEQALEHRLGLGDNPSEPAQPRFWSRGEAFYNRLAKWIGGKGGAWFLFITSAMIISPFYFAALAAGTLRMGLLRFFLITWAGKTVKYLTVAFAGHYGLNFLLQWIGG